MQKFGLPFFGLFLACAAKTSSHEDASSSGTREVQFNLEVSAAKKLSLDLYLPIATAAPRPTVLLIHGGGWRSRTRADMNFIAKKLQANGFAVVNMSYRFAPKFRYPSQIDDCFEVLKWVETNASKYHFDLKRLAAMGYSSGAHLASLLGLLDSKVTRMKAGVSKDLAEKDYPAIQAVVAGGSPNDLTVYKDSKLVIGLLGKKYEEDPDLYERASPLFHVHSRAPAFFLFHGRSDWIVETAQMYKMEGALKAAKVSVETYEASLGHIAVFLANAGVIDKSVEFLKRKLLL